MLFVSWCDVIRCIQQQLCSVFLPKVIELNIITRKSSENSVMWDIVQEVGLEGGGSVCTTRAVQTRGPEHRSPALYVVKARLAAVMYLQSR